MQAKKGIYYTSIDSDLKISPHTSNWSLVIGAGVSYPIFPSWPDLIRTMYTDIYETQDKLEIDNMIKSFPLDSILQSLKNYSNLSDDDFIKKISENLYKNAWESVAPNQKDREIIFKVLSSPLPQVWDDKVWEAFFAIITDNYRDATFYKISEVLFKGYKKNILPVSVITFNAEPLLYATLTSLIREYYGLKKKKSESLKQRLDIITRSIYSTNYGRIPFYHIHGYLPIPFIKCKIEEPMNSIEKLVFSENEYLNLANTTFNWQSSVFMHASFTHSLIFIGLSFTDLNLRKWLSWTHSNRLNEINQVDPSTNKDKYTSKHFWIRTKPTTFAEESLIENNVAHLGVRIIWTDNYSQLSDALAKLVGIS